ncbi:MAG TPA: hypothetical protein VFT12_07285 [Thermoanaerobaculia bacterium]|nr:hypothetical protein [Thermoanaerobaculia bacterium]
MSELPPESPAPPEEAPEPALMPRWVPVAIGVVLVTLAALAVFTGLRYREDTLVGMVESRRSAPRHSAAPPGEPEPGASRMLSGNSGGNVPAANTPVEGDTRATISGGPGGVSSVVRMRARRGILVKADPSDAVVYINDIPVGHARELDTEDEMYDFAAPGSYNVRVVAPGLQERAFIVTVGEDAPAEVARIDVKLERPSSP